jgi:3-methyladenine DNA glycosylase AlkD
MDIDYQVWKAPPMQKNFEYTSYPEFLEYLNSFAEPDFAAFQRKLIPGETILGVRTPRVRTIAKQIAKGDWRRFLADARDGTLEEAEVQGLVIGAAKMDYNEALERAAAFVPKIKSWASCDICGSSFKFLKKEPERSFEFLKGYLSDEREFAVRFGVTLLMEFFTSEEFLSRLFTLYEQVHHEGYYVKMAVAWAVSLCFVKFPEQTMEYLKTSCLNDWTYNKALQKITESNRVDAEQKRTVRAMKRKG